MPIGIKQIIQSTGNKLYMTVKLANKSWTKSNWAGLPDFLTKSECSKLESLCGDFNSGEIGPNVGIIESSIRRSEVAWIAPNNNSEWLYNRLWAAVDVANHKIFNYDIKLIEPLQYTIYHSNNSGFYRGHYDWGLKDMGTGIRKLSFTIQLTDPQEYKGGDLVLHTGDIQPVIALKKQGSITIFPSWVFHEVTPVTEGTRRSLVGWFQGPVYF